MNENTGRSRRYLITKNSILMLVMLVIIFLAIWAWFGVSDSAEASGIRLKSTHPDEIEIAVPKKNVQDGVSTDYFPISNNDWDYSIQFENTGYLNDLVKDVTSDGSEFIIPGFNASTDYKTGRTVNVESFWEKALSSKEVLSDDKPNNDDQYHFVSLDFYLRSKNKSIKLTENSYLAAGSELGIYYDENQKKFVTGDVKGLTGSGNNVYRQSSYGNFSSDAIVGAMRVSLVGTPVNSIAETSIGSDLWLESAYRGGETEWSSAAQKKVTWLPRPDLFLNTTNDENNWTLSTGVRTNDTNAPKTYYHTFYSPDENGRSYKKGVEKHVYYDPNVKDYAGGDSAYSTDSGKFKVSKYFGGSYPKLGQSAQIADDATTTSIIFKEGTGEKASRPITGYYVYKYSLNLWIEGEDEEARRSMSDGLFSLYLEFGS